MDNDIELDKLFRKYRDACPEVEPGVRFMPTLWQKIEERQTFWAIFERFWGRAFATASAAMCLLLLLLLTLVSPSVPGSAAPTYADALMADHSAERTYYAEAIRNVPAPEDSTPQPPR